MVRAPLAGCQAARRASYPGLTSGLKRMATRVGHIKGRAQMVPSALERRGTESDPGDRYPDARFAALLAGLPCHRGEACEAGRRFCVPGARFRHVEPLGQGGELTRTRDAGGDIGTRRHPLAGRDQLVTFAVDVAPLPGRS